MGKKWTDEQRANLSAKTLARYAATKPEDRYHPDDTVKAKISASMKGKSTGAMPEETKDKIRQALLAKHAAGEIKIHVWTDEERQAMREKMLAIYGAGKLALMQTPEPEPTPEFATEPVTPIKPKNPRK